MQLHHSDNSVSYCTSFLLMHKQAEHNVFYFINSNTYNEIIIFTLHI